MKIAQVVCVFPPYKSGIGNIALNFAQIAYNSNHESTVFTPDYNSQKSLVISGEFEFNVVRLKPILEYGNAAFIPALFFYLSKFDIIHWHYPFFGANEIIWLSRLFKKNKPKLIVHYHMDTVDLSFSAKILSVSSKILINSLLSQAQAITVASLDYVKNSQIKNIYKKQPELFYELPFAVDNNFFHPLEKKLTEDKNIIFVGALDKAHYFKGLDVLLNAVSLLKDKEINLTIIGEGDRKEKYKELTKKLNIAQKVKFVGDTNNQQLAEILRKSSVLVLPSTSRHEAFGLVLLEAMSSGIPVIASNLPGVRSVFEDNLQGLFIEPGNVNDLIEKIEKIFEDKHKRIKMGIEARILVDNKYSFKNLSSNLSRIYDSI